MFRTLLVSTITTAIVGLGVATPVDDLSRPSGFMDPSICKIFRWC